MLCGSKCTSPILIQTEHYKQVNLWTTFAATGDPNGAKLTAVVADHWSTANKEDSASESGYKLLNIGGDRLEMIDFPETKRIAFLDSLERAVL